MEDEEDGDEVAGTVEQVMVEEDVESVRQQGQRSIAVKVQGGAWGQGRPSCWHAIPASPRLVLTGSTACTTGSTSLTEPE